MGITNFSALSIESGVSCGAIDAGAVTGSTLSLSGTLSGAAINPSTVSLTGTLSAAAITSSGISLDSPGVVSLVTVTDAASVVTESLALLHAASGISLCYRSGDTLYILSGWTLSDPSLMSQAY